MADIYEPLALRFLSNEIKAIVVQCPENERPLQGLAGFLDHRLKRPLSHGLLTGAINGKEGEVALIPVSLNGKSFYIFTVGAGEVEVPGKRPRISQKTLTKLKTNLKGMKLLPVGLSASDLGGLDLDEIKKLFQEIEWVGEA